MSLDENSAEGSNDGSSVSLEEPVDREFVVAFATAKDDQTILQVCNGNADKAAKLIMYLRRFAASATHTPDASGRPEFVQRKVQGVTIVMSKARAEVDTMRIDPNMTVGEFTQSILKDLRNLL